MPVDLDAPNRAAFRTFGAQVQTGKMWTFTPLAGAAFDIDVIYDEAWSAIQIKSTGVGGRGGIAPVSTTAPAVLVRLADVPAGARIEQGGALKNNVTQQTYSVADVQPDGMGCLRLHLNETS